MEDTRYFSCSWHLLTRQRGWIKPILVLAIALLVPVAGPLALSGYALEWARLSAWGVDASPKQRDVRAGECIASGWRAFVVGLVWTIAFVLASVIVTGVLQALFGGWGESLGQMLTFVCGFLFSLIVLVAGLRAAIYTKIRAGLNPARVFEMVGRDAGGLFKIIGIPLVTALILGAVMLVGYVVLFVAVMGDVTGYIGYLTYDSSSALLFQLIGGVLGKVLPTFVVLWYVGAVVSVASTLLEVNAIGLWMRQFDVPVWGGPSDPLPAPRGGLPAASNPVPPVTNAPTDSVVPTTPVVAPVTPSPIVASAPAAAPESTVAPVESTADVPQDTSSVAPAPEHAPQAPEPEPSPAGLPLVTPETTAEDVPQDTEVPFGDANGPVEIPAEPPTPPLEPAVEPMPASENPQLTGDDSEDPTTPAQCASTDAGPAREPSADSPEKSE